MDCDPLSSQPQWQGCAESGHPRNYDHRWVRREVTILLDDLLGRAEDRRRHNDADRFGGGEINGQAEPRRALDWQLARPRTMQDPVHIFRRAPEDRTHIG